MSLIRRISTTITSSVDRAISRVEDHDAVIDAALRDTRRSAARSRVRLERLRRDGAGLRARRDALQDSVQRWSERARRSAEDDESTALECLRRRRRCEAQLTKLCAAIERHDELEARISEQVSTIESRIGEMSQQRNVLRSRQSVADAMAAIQRIEGTHCSEVEDAFDRWEINLGECEYLFGAAAPADPLDASFSSEEETADLRAELDELLKDGKEDAS